jgi:hypothetical protein
MITSTTVLNIIYVFAALTLFYTFQNDFNVFLLTLLLLLGALWSYLFTTEYIDMFNQRIAYVNKMINEKIDNINYKLFGEYTPQKI